MNAIRNTKGVATVAIDFTDESFPKAYPVQHSSC